MDFNGTIIITDPGHFTKDEDWGIGFDIEDCVIESSLGFSNYIFLKYHSGVLSLLIFASCTEYINSHLIKQVINLACDSRVNRA